MSSVTNLLRDTPVYVGCFAMPEIPRHGLLLVRHNLVFLDDVSILVYTIVSDEVRW